MSQINQTMQTAQLDPSNIEVLVWNVYKGDRLEWAMDFDQLTKSKDILLLQEGMLNRKMKDQFMVLPWFEFHFATSFIDNKLGAVGTGVVTASEAKSVETVWQRSYYREPMIKTPKMTLFTKYGLEGLKKKVLVGNIHGINFVKAYKLRHMLDKAAEHIRGHKGPVIFGGDFNTWTKTKLNNMNAVFKKLGMRAVKFKDDNRKRFRGHILDHVWVRRFKVLSSLAPKVNGSDHNPMIVKLQLE